MAEITDAPTAAELDAWERWFNPGSGLYQASSLSRENQLRLIAAVRQLRALQNPICLICGASEPCMTEADLKPGDPGVPCTFDPTPQELYAEVQRLRERVALCPHCGCKLAAQAREAPPMPEG